MRFFIFLLILAAFLQTAFLPLNLCLILIIVRSFAVEERQNYYLAFIAGVFLAILSPVNIGFWAILFLINVKLIHVVRRFPITDKGITIVPVTIMMLLITAYIEKIVFGVSVSVVPIFIGGLISLPFYLLIRIWEERFVMKHEIKLKV